MLRPRIAHKAAFTVLGLAKRFSMSNNTIPQLWEEFDAIKSEISNPSDETCYGVCFYEKDYDEAKDDTFTYMAGMAVNSQEAVPASLSARTLPEGDYAVFEHHGALDTLRDTYTAIYRDWLPSSDYEYDNRDDFELYDERFDFGKDESIMEIWIPVKKKS